MFRLTAFSLQVQHANDSFLVLSTDGINFLLSDQEICDVINQCQDPTEAADVIAQQVSAFSFGKINHANASDHQDTKVPQRDRNKR